MTEIPDELFEKMVEANKNGTLKIRILDDAEGQSKSS